MCVSKGILGFKVERSAVESVLDSQVRSWLIELGYSGGCHRVLLDVYGYNRTTISLQSHVYASDHTDIGTRCSQLWHRRKVSSRSHSNPVECHHFAPPRFRVSKQRQPGDLASIGAHATQITAFTTIEAAFTQDCQLENAQTITDNSHTTIPAQHVIRALARLSQQS